MKEQIIKQKAFMIFADMQHGIKPRSNESARQWLRLALIWALRNRRINLANLFKYYLNASALQPGITTLALSAA